MTHDEAVRLLAERAVSDGEYEAALAAARPQLPSEVEGNCASAAEVALKAAHRIDAPRLVRAVEAALHATLCAHCAGDAQSYESFKAKGRAAFWRAYTEEFPE